MTSLINFYFNERSKFVKEYDQNIVLLMQVGSFYEILDKNDTGDNGGARKVSQVLNILLTKKQIN